MADPVDMIIPMLREMRAEISARFDGVDVRLDTVEKRLKALEDVQASFKQALVGDSLLSKRVTGEFEGWIEALERKARELEGRP